MSAEDASVLAKAGAIVKVLEVDQNALCDATKKTQAAVAVMLLTRMMARRD